MKHPYSPKNWTEDFPTENGNYTCMCCICEQEFIGNKYRVICKECSLNGNKQLESDNVKLLKQQTENNVLKYRGSYDAPGFDACVDAELANHTFSEDDIKKHANKFADFLWLSSGESGHSDVWREWVRNEFQKLLEAVEYQLSKNYCKETTETKDWQPPHTIPKDREVLIKTSTGIVSGKFFPGELSRENPYQNEEYNPPVFSCYDDEIVIDCDYQELVEGEFEEYFPEILGWMEIPK